MVTGVQLKPILMSIKSHYANLILAGEKSHEFRKSEVEPGTTVVVYRSGGATQRGIVGTFVAGDVTNGTASFLHSITEKPGISLEKLVAYGTWKPGHAQQLWRIEATQIEKFWRPIPLSAIRVPRAPQSWMWSTDAAVTTLREMNEVPF